MPTKAVGTQAPPVSLKSLDGQIYNLSETLQTKPVVVLAFYKISCPVCQFAFPFIERLHKSYPEIPIWGVSQDDQADTEEFAKEYGVTFPMILDEQLQATVNYGLVSVPSMFVVKANGEIEQTIFGFAKADLEHLNRRLAQAAGVPEKPLFTDADDVPTLRPG
jgi:peroxiredoxin